MITLRASTPNRLDWLARKSLIESIEIYQKHISPKKGFSCAYRILHSDQSCSDYVKTLLTRHSLKSALPIAQQRFQDCAVASRVFKAARRPGDSMMACRTVL